MSQLPSLAWAPKSSQIPARQNYRGSRRPDEPCHSSSASIGPGGRELILPLSNWTGPRLTLSPLEAPCRQAQPGAWLPPDGRYRQLRVIQAEVIGG